MSAPIGGGDYSKQLRDIGKTFVRGDGAIGKLNLADGPSISIKAVQTSKIKGFLANTLSKIGLERNWGVRYQLDGTSTAPMTSKEIMAKLNSIKNEVSEANKTTIENTLTEAHNTDNCMNNGLTEYEKGKLNQLNMAFVTSFLSSKNQGSYIEIALDKRNGNPVANMDVVADYGVVKFKVIMADDKNRIDKRFIVSINVGGKDLYLDGKSNVGEQCSMIECDEINRNNIIKNAFKHLKDRGEFSSTETTKMTEIPKEVADKQNEKYKEIIKKLDDTMTQVSNIANEAINDSGKKSTDIKMIKVELMGINFSIGVANNKLSSTAVNSDGTSHGVFLPRENAKTGENQLQEQLEKQPQELRGAILKHISDTNLEFKSMELYADTIKQQSQQQQSNSML
ncbi:MAG: hypothetical protein LBB20_02030 [Puniceicoccales bacterium]|jgi:hypothetical protein|nr:hypothetical protein [Puniceicoccales bacterium]